VSEKISLYFGANKFSNWEEISVKKSIEGLCGSFAMNISDRWTPYGKNWFLHDQDQVKIKIGSDLISTGFIDASKPAGDASGSSLSLQGREKTCDLVDCSATNKTGSWKKATFRQLVTDLIHPDGTNPYKISIDFKAELTGAEYPFQLQSGETVFSALNRLCKAEEVLMVTTPEGNVEIINPGSERADVILEIGRNIEAWDANFDYKDRFSAYTVRGQASGDGSNPWKKTSKGLKAESADDGVSRYRPHVLIAEAAATGELAAGRAKWEAVTRKANSIQVNVTVAGFRQTEGGNLWRPNLVIKTRIPRAELDQDLLISEVEFTRGGNGTLSKLKLIPVDSYAKKPLKLKKGRKSGVTWR
jgi:prophage tail gpP-like protein